MIVKSRIEELSRQVIKNTERILILAGKYKKCCNQAERCWICEKGCEDIPDPEMVDG